MEKARPASLASSDTVRVTNPGGSSPFVLTCDHASNFLPAEFGTLGLAAEDLSRHIAWDPGALPVATRMGYAQELERRLSRFSNFAVSFSIICILSGGINSLAQGTSGAGGIGIGIGWLVGCFVSLTFAVAMLAMLEALVAMTDEIVPEIAWQMGRPVRYGGEFGGVKERTNYMLVLH